MSPEKLAAKLDESAGQQQDVWQELFSTVSFLSDTVELSLQAFSPEQAVGADGKAVSATTKKRMAVKSVHNLRLSKDSIGLLQEHLKALQVASQQWQKTMMYASKSHEELMEQLENTNRDLHITTERLRSMEAQNLATNRELDSQRAQLHKLEAEHRAVQSTLQQRCDDLETARFANMELQAQMAQYGSEAAAAREHAQAAQQERDRAVAALDAVKADADKATGAAQRHQEAIAKLTADNLVFLMNLKKAESELAAAHQEKAQLQLAVEKQRGPWFDEVRASVEERVRHAMVKAETLEQEMEALRQQHAAQLQGVESQKSDLEEFLSKMRHQEAALEQELTAARAARDDAVAAAAAARAAAAAAEQRLEELSMRCSVLQDNVKGMRQECTERWVKEQDALGKVSGLQSHISTLEQLSGEQQGEVQRLRQQLETQHAVNRQLMSKKEEIEWQLLAALAKVGGELTSVIPPPKAPPPPASSSHVLPAAVPPAVQPATQAATQAAMTPQPAAHPPAPPAPAQPPVIAAPAPAEPPSKPATTSTTAATATVSSLAPSHASLNDPLPRRLASDFYVPIKPAVSPATPIAIKPPAPRSPAKPIITVTATATSAISTAAPASPFSLQAAQQRPVSPVGGAGQGQVVPPPVTSASSPGDQHAATGNTPAAPASAPPYTCLPPPLAQTTGASTGMIHPGLVGQAGTGVTADASDGQSLPQEVSLGGALPVSGAAPGVVSPPEASPAQPAAALDVSLSPWTGASRVRDAAPPVSMRPAMGMFGDDAFSITHSSPLSKGPRLPTIQPLHPIFGTLPVNHAPKAAAADTTPAANSPTASEDFGGQGRRVSATTVMTTPPPKARTSQE